MRISDWSSDVCSSDLGVDQAEMKVDAVAHRIDRRLGREAGLPAANARDFAHDLANGDGAVGGGDRIGGGASDLELVGAEFGEHEIGRAACRERVCQYVKISVVAGSVKKKRDYNYDTTRT